MDIFTTYINILLLLSLNPFKTSMKWISYQISTSYIQSILEFPKGKERERREIILNFKIISVINVKYTVSTVITPAALSHLWLANSLIKAPIVMLSIIGPAALQPIQWLRMLLKIMISQKRCRYYNRAALIRVRKLIQSIGSYFTVTWQISVTSYFIVTGNCN